MGLTGVYGSKRRPHVSLQVTPETWRAPSSEPARSIKRIESGHVSSGENESRSSPVQLACSHVESGWKVAHASALSNVGSLQLGGEGGGEGGESDVDEYQAAERMIITMTVHTQQSITAT